MNMFNISPVEITAERSVPVVERELTGDDKSALIRKCINLPLSLIFSLGNCVKSLLH